MKIRTRGLVAAALLAVAACSAANTSLQVSVLDKEGKPVTNAVVVVVSAGRSTTSAALPKDVVISQQNMRFVPAVSVVAVGAKAHFVNNDPWEHHVRASAAGVAQFNADVPGGFELRIDGKQEGKTDNDKPHGMPTFREKNGNFNRPTPARAPYAALSSTARRAFKWAAKATGSKESRTFTSSKRIFISASVFNLKLRFLSNAKASRSRARTRRFAR